MTISCPGGGIFIPKPRLKLRITGHLTYIEVDGCRIEKGLPHNICASSAEFLGRFGGYGNYPGSLEQPLKPTFMQNEPWNIWGEGGLGARRGRASLSHNLQLDGDVRNPGGWRFEKKKAP